MEQKSPPPHWNWFSHHPHSLSPASRPPPPLASPSRSPVGPHSVQPPAPTHRRGLTLQPLCFSLSPALAERGTTCPSGGLYPEPRRGGAGRSLRLRQARAQHRAPPRSQRVSRRPGCQKQSRGGLARGAKATGEARRAAEGLPGSVARDGGNRARCGSSLRAGSWSAGLVGCMCGVSSTPSQRTV